LDTGGESVAYGWVADAGAAIGELDVAFRLEANDRYLWDFVTLPAWRGRGVYPHLLQAILRAEEGGRFWIINAPENVASARRPGGDGRALPAHRLAARPGAGRRGDGDVEPVGGDQRAAPARLPPPGDGRRDRPPAPAQPPRRAGTSSGRCRGRASGRKWATTTPSPRRASTRSWGQFRTGAGEVVTADFVVRVE
jgi:hypothetical protein